MNSDLKVGDRVNLVDIGDYYLGPANPEVGSEWECEGTVTRISDETIKVNWDNGTTNWYSGLHSDLEIVGFSLALPV